MCVTYKDCQFRSYETCGDVDGLSTTISSIVSTLFLNSSLMVYGKLYDLHLIGVSSVCLIWCQITTVSVSHRLLLR